MTHFKDALAILPRYNEWRRGSEIAQPNAKQVGEAIDTAIKALRIADRLMGEPSEAMIKAAWFSQYKSVGATDEEAIKLSHSKYESEKHISIPAYKAMRDQLLKEIDNDTTTP